MSKIERELPSLAKGAGLRIQSHRSSGVQIPFPAFFILFLFTNNKLIRKIRIKLKLKKFIMFKILFNITNTFTSTQLK